MNPQDFDLTQASRVYGIANTPPFLVRKLQADPTVRAISDSCGGEQIIEQLQRIVAAEPTDATEAVRPYVYLVALWFKPEINHLREAAKIQAPNYRWFGWITELLMETFSPVHQQLVEVPMQVTAPSVTVGLSAPTIVIYEG